MHNEILRHPKLSLRLSPLYVFLLLWSICCERWLKCSLLDWKSNKSMLFSLKLDFSQGTVFTMCIYLSSSPMDGSLQLMCWGSVKNGGNSSYCSPSWGLYCVLLFVLFVSSVAEMTSSITRKIFLWLAFLEHWGKVKKNVLLMEKHHS